MIEDLGDAEIEMQLYLSRYLIFIPFTILLYDYVLTFEREVARYWGTPLVWGTVLFYINRYSALIGTIPVVVEYLLTTTDPSKVKVCDGLQSYHKYFALLSQILVSIMLITRTYALYERNKIVLACMISVTLGAIAFALWILLSGNDSDTLSPHLQAFGCPSPSSHASNLRAAAAWGGMLVFDVMIFALTLHKALRYGTRGGNLFSLLIRDGALYFGIMITSNACNIGTYTMGGPLISGSATTVTNALSSVMISRLMLNLRDPAIRQRTRTTRDTTTQDSAAITTMTPYMGTDIALDTMWHRSYAHGEDTDTRHERYA
ncbi:hypothetical protein C8R44DRAFT_768986 [Mycena epipterygia]|nr:hypothetical protein C8R44DRAFT_768986 [Mycena epipterygia]